MSSDRILTGVAASPGAAIGRAVRAFDPLFITFNYKIRSDQTAAEIERFRDSVRKSRRQLKRIQAHLNRRSGPESSFLVDAHILILQDPLFVDRIVDRIQQERLNA